MNRNRRLPGLVYSVVGLAFLGLLFLLYREWRTEQDRKDETRALCELWADRLDKQTTDTGVYVRWEGETLPETDPWGSELRVSYSQGGVAEAIDVRSLGPDGQSHTPDDIVAHRIAMNFKGVGTGVKNGVEETARNATKGAVRGLIDGTRDALKGEDQGK